jgi:hypothetical protein
MLNSRGLPRLSRLALALVHGSVGDLVPGGCGAGINCFGGVSGTCGNCHDASGNYLGCFQRRVTCAVPTVPTSIRELAACAQPPSAPSGPVTCDAGLYRPITTSISNLAAPLVNDGDTSTEWSTPTLSTISEWWVVLDLAQVRTVHRVSVAWGNAHPNSYAIETGNDGTSWTGVYTETGGASYTAGQQPELTSALPGPPSTRWLRIRASATASVAPTTNLVETGVATSGGFGGTCTCPDGQVY